jgi:hypothetical protein
VLLFLLPAHLLKKMVLDKINNDPEISDCAQWLTSNGIELEPLQHVQRLALVFAPVMAVPLGSFLNF